MTYYFPLAELRKIPVGSLIHESVFKKIATKDYNPINIPENIIENWKKENDQPDINESTKSDKILYQ